MRCSLCDYCSEIEGDDGREYTIQGHEVICSVCVSEFEDLYPEYDDEEGVEHDGWIIMAGAPSILGPEEEDEAEDDDSELE